MNWLSHKYFWLYSHLKYSFYPKPSYLLRVVKNLLLAKLYLLLGIKKFVLRGVDLAVTFSCNFNCGHCYAKRLSNPSRREMTVTDFERVCDESMKLGATTFSLQGGEVFLHRQPWADVIKAFQPKKNHVIITTNGSLTNEEDIKTLKELGVDTLYFSVDSGIAEEHDKFRKRKGNFSKIMENIQFCRKHGVKVVINVCVGKYNIYSEGLRKLLDYSHRNRVLICTLLARPLGNWEDRFEVMLGDVEMKHLQMLREQYPFAVRDLSNNYGREGCQALKEYVYITAYGDVCPCPFTHIVIGNIFEESLKDIRERGLKVHWWDHYHETCLTGRDETFMKKYYPKIEEKPLISLEEFLRE